jgi:hypothetical protein
MCVRVKQCVESDLHTPYSLLTMEAVSPSGLRRHATQRALIHHSDSRSVTVVLEWMEWFVQQIGGILVVVMTKVEWFFVVVVPRDVVPCFPWRNLGTWNLPLYAMDIDLGR